MELESCPTCGAVVIAVVGSKDVIATCSECETDIPALVSPIPVQYIPVNEDYRDVEIVLESYGDNLLVIARIVRSLLDVTSRESLNLVRSAPVVLAIRDSYSIRRLEDFSSEISRAGGRCSLNRIN